MIPIPAQYYQLVYIIIIILISIPVCMRYASYSVDRLNSVDNEPIVGSLLFTIFIILFVGFRPNSSIFADGPGYWAGILDHRWEGGTLSDVNYQFATKWLMSFLSSFNISPRIGFIAFSTIIYGGAFVAMRKLFPKDTLLAMIMFCGAFGTFWGAVNGIKNGMACSMFICALAYKDNWKVCLLMLLLSFGFHHSLELLIAAFVICLFYKNTKVYSLIWTVSLILAILHVTYFQTFFAGFTDEQGAGYLLGENIGGKGGLRLDFIAYSFAPIALAWWVSKKKIFQPEYRFVFNEYLLTNAIWMLCMFASYTNRIAALSWSLFPVIILMPLLGDKVADNQYKVLSLCVIGQMSFTLLMAIISL